MSITTALFKIRFPEFVSQDNARVQLFIDDAVIMLNETAWGDKYDLGLYYLSAHYLKKALRSEAISGNAPTPSGAIVSRSVDGASVSYADNKAESAFEAQYSSTIYGQRYLAMLKTLGIPAFTV